MEYQKGSIVLVLDKSTVLMEGDIVDKNISSPQQKRPKKHKKLTLNARRIEPLEKLYFLHKWEKA